MKMRFPAASMLCMSLAFLSLTTRFCSALNLNGEENMLLNSALENLENSPYYENQEEEGGNQDLDQLHSRLNLQQLYQHLYRQNQNGGWADLEKRAPSAGFFGVRGKKSPSQGFYGVRGKKAPSGFYGVRGKKFVVPSSLSLGMLPQYLYQGQQPSSQDLMAHGQGPLAVLADKTKENPDATTTNNGQEPQKRVPSDGFMGLRGKRNASTVNNKNNTKDSKDNGSHK